MKERNHHTYQLFTQGTNGARIVYLEGYKELHRFITQVLQWPDDSNHTLRYPWPHRKGFVYRSSKVLPAFARLHIASTLNEMSMQGPTFHALFRRPMEALHLIRQKEGPAYSGSFECSMQSASSDGLTDRYETP